MERTGLMSYWVTRIIILNVIVFLFQNFYSSNLIYSFALVPSLIYEKFMVWQLVTYMFLHGDILHIFFNMYLLFILGIQLEDEWGSKKFLVYYFFTGIGAGISIFTISLLAGDQTFFVPTIGASGAVYGLLLAFAILYPEAEFYFIVIPIKAKYLIVLYAAFELIGEFSGGKGNISHIGHLGGLFFGLVYFFVFEKGRSLFHKKKLVKVKAKYSPQTVSIAVPEVDRKKAILEKLNSSGIESLTDDEYQYIKYLDIMVDDLKDQKDNASGGIDLLDKNMSDRDFMAEVRKFFHK